MIIRYDLLFRVSLEKNTENNSNFLLKKLYNLTI